MAVRTHIKCSWCCFDRPACLQRRSCWLRRRNSRIASRPSSRARQLARKRRRRVQQPSQQHLPSWRAWVQTRMRMRMKKTTRSAQLLSASEQRRKTQSSRQQRRATEKCRGLSHTLTCQSLSLTCKATSGVTSSSQPARTLAAKTAGPGRRAAQQQPPSLQPQPRPPRRQLASQRLQVQQHQHQQVQPLVGLQHALPLLLGPRAAAPAAAVTRGQP